MSEKILAIISRTEPEPHCELHFDKHVEFWSLDGRKIGESRVYKHDDIKDKDWKKLKW